jgi:DNA-directed RNA polymerase specialized sigma24 family protein
MTQPLPAAAPVPTGSSEVTWLQPYPDKLLNGLPADDLGPEARVERNEAVSPAFITALQLLSPRARAILILRDVLGFTAREAARFESHTLRSFGLPRILPERRFA